MNFRCDFAIGRRLARIFLSAACLLWASSAGPTGCGPHRRVTIAVIPRTEGTVIWEAAHVGAELAARRSGVSIYWSAPTREDDVEGQIALVERAVKRHYDGLVLAPDQALSLITPVDSALQHGTPTVIIGSPLPIPAGGELSYILNDDAEGGRMAARRIATLLHGHGTVAVLGIDPDVTAIMIRYRAFEEYLVQNCPGIRIAERRMGSFNFPHEQQVAEETLKAHPDLEAIVALMSTSVDATLSVLASGSEGHPVKVVGFDVAGWPLFDRSSLDSVVQEDTRSMGERAVESIEAERSGAAVPAVTKIPPVVITRDNLNSAQVQEVMAQDWTLGRWNWSIVQ